MAFFGMKSDALLSKDLVYRHWLMRSWNKNPPCTFIQLNPSTADAYKNDNTIRKDIGFCNRWGFGTLYGVNLFDFRATVPEEMKRALRPNSLVNDDYIMKYALLAHKNNGRVVAAWGTHGEYKDRGVEVLVMLMEAGIPLYSLGTTKNGEPKHPLYVSYDTKLERLPVA